MPLELYGEGAALVPDGPYPGMQGYSDGDGCIDDGNDDIPQFEFLIPAPLVTSQQERKPIGPALHGVPDSNIDLIKIIIAIRIFALAATHDIDHPLHGINMLHPDLGLGYQCVDGDIILADINTRIGYVNDIGIEGPVELKHRQLSVGAGGGGLVCGVVVWLLQGAVGVDGFVLLIEWLWVDDLQRYALAGWQQG